MNARFSVSAIRELVSLIRNRNIDVIHTHGYKSDIMGLIAARVAGIKVISTPHGFGEPTDFKLKAFIALGKFSLKFFDRVVPLSEQLVDEVREAGIADKKIDFIRNAVDLKEVEQYRVNKKENGDATRKIRVGYIGQMIPRKKIDHILNIFNQMWLENKNIELHLLGDGKSRMEMETLAKTLPSAESILFLGFRNDRLELLSQFDLFVMIDQLVKHKKTGLLANYGDQKTLKKYWQKLLTEKNMASELAQNGREFVNERYSGQRMAKEYTLLYDELVSTN